MKETNREKSQCPPNATSYTFFHIDHFLTNKTDQSDTNYP